MKTWLAMLGLAIVAFYFAARFPYMQKGMDFADFYAAAQIVHDGNGAHLYDPQTQDIYLSRYAGRTGTYFIHPAFETLLFLPFTGLSLTKAYAAWCAVNAGLLALISFSIPRQLRLPVTWQFLIFIFLMFVPILLNFMQGQDAVLLLLFLVLGYRAAAHGHEFLAGCLLGCGLIKFHIAAPLLIPLAVVYSKKLVAGFAALAAVCISVSALITGWAGIIAYPRFLARLAQMPLAGSHVEAMANLRGLLAILAPAQSSRSFWLVLLSSFIVMAMATHAAVMSKKSDMRQLGWAMAVLSAALVSYHLSPHDLTILLLPVCLLVDHLLTRREIPRLNRGLVITLISLLLLPPSHLIFLNHHLYSPLGVLTLLLFASSYLEVLRCSRVATAQIST